MLRSRALPAQAQAQAPSSPTTSPLELLLERLPRLLALSLTLSSRFEDDPSPFGVAEAFVEMEEEMITEIGLWAGEVGNIVAVGMGEMLDMSANRGRSRRSVSGDAMTDDESNEDRLGFADIVSPSLCDVFPQLTARSSCQSRGLLGTSFSSRVSSPCNGLRV